MAEAKGRPRPDTCHPDALADDPEGTHGGNARDDVTFDVEGALPGGGDHDGAEPCDAGAHVF